MSRRTKKLILFVLLVALPGPLTARLAREDWTFEEMFAKSDLVVIATPIAIFETQEHTTLKDIAPPVEVLGLRTEFQVRLVLKGDKKMNKFVLHHYKLEHEEPMTNGPELVSFDSRIWGTPCFLFLVREHDGRYAPVTGQTDPALYSVIQLQTETK
jgi:hypothetical protein